MVTRSVCLMNYTPTAQFQPQIINREPVPSENICRGKHGRHGGRRKRNEKGKSETRRRNSFGNLLVTVQVEINSPQLLSCKPVAVLQLHVTFPIIATIDAPPASGLPGPRLECSTMSS